MPEPTPSEAPLDRGTALQRGETPRALWDAVLDARTVWAAERHLAGQASSSVARDELLFALEAYVRSLHERRRPVPYALRDELRLIRLTASSSRVSRPTGR